MTYRPISEVTPGHVISRSGGQATKEIVCVRGQSGILNFSLNGELVWGAWLLKSFQQREGQRILLYSHNSVENEAQKARLECQTLSDLAHRIRREDLVDDATELYRVCGDHFISGT